MEALLCELRQLIHRKGTRAEFRLLVDEKIAPEYRQMADRLKRAEGEREDAREALDMERRGRDKTDAKCTALTSRLEQASEILDVLATFVEKMVKAGYAMPKSQVAREAARAKAFVTDVDANDEKPPDAPEGSPRCSSRP